MNTCKSSLPDIGRGMVSHRRVYYLSGFDPRGASFYHRLYRDEAAKQTSLSGATLLVGPRCREPGQVSRWQVTADWNGHRVETDYHFLGWDDIVRQHWQANRYLLLAEGVRGLLHYIAHGALASVRRAGRGPFFSALFPYVGIAMLCVISCVLAGVSALVVEWFIGSWLMGVVCGAFVGIVAGRWGIGLAERGGVFWLLRTYLFAYRWGLGPIDELEARMDSMAARILRDSREHPVDEVLIVSHSVGTMLAVSVAARLLRSAQHDISAHKMLTLGSCIPLLSLVPGAQVFRQDLTALGASTQLSWIDVAAVADPLCFAGTHPLLVSGVAAPSASQPRLITARFFRLFSPEHYRTLKRNKLRLHFQYLMAGDITGDYDYFRLTAGPDSIKDF